MSTPIDRYAVMGHPVSHSLSPRIHQQFAAETGQKLEYEAILVPREGFSGAVARFRSAGGRGLNITVPFKEEAWRLAGKLSARARAAGAVNTLSFGATNDILGDNTDGVGLLTDLTCNLGLILAGRRILLLGAGGAARGVIGPLLAERPTTLIIANRNRVRAEQLAADFSLQGPISGCGLDTLSDEAPFDLIVNATSASLAGEALALPTNLTASQTFAYDMVYAAAPTPFMRWSVAHGAACAADGLGMLVEQAAEAFFVWRGIRPRTPSVITDLRDFLSGAYA
ncbi:shikimate dehydrogenase [Acidihalobacter yilgarnensis]|uniref:Shikimate dehydrogenase (NADP(+)) n=1 Tax=Acidihalobacter yilgarnensis TaxID=2819280 RepID=A0A1D8IJR2_9GAMM|nr:shikimate dehydrogenase [Acidihalobacter yilgarnensis]AOU96718.1 shikimate dehydrogenase [Acidihalobacter yilgarnensis]